MLFGSWKLACLVTISFGNGDPGQSYPFPTYQKATAFAVEILETEPDAHAVTACDPIAEKAYKAKRKAKVGK